jgi:hypothetical protein
MTREPVRSIVRAATIVVLVAATASPVLARPLAAQDSTSLRFAQLERALADAMIARDSAALTAMVAPGFELAGAGNEEPPLPRAPWIAFTIQRYRMDSLGIRDLAATLHGADSAVVRLRLWWHPTLDGRLRNPEENLLQDTWVRAGGRWQLTRRLVLATDPPRRPRPTPVTKTPVDRP